MHAHSHGINRVIALLLGIVALAATGIVLADPPARVARVGYVNGPVSFSPAGEEDWVEATLNRPIVTGDRLWADAAARVELQIGSAAIRLGAATSITLLNLDDRVAQVQLAQGTLDVRVRRLDRDQVFEVDTPNLAFVIRRPGQYRVSVDPNGDATEVRTSSGQAEVYGGEGAVYVVDAGKSFRFAGTDLRDYESAAFPAPDEFDRWAQERDRSYDNSISARYVSRDVIGYQDLDASGTWRVVPEYGNVWTPTRVSAGWAPYRDGHWAWIDPWGWTWVDDAPWGFAVSHYGRWANIRGSWGWIPGPVAARAVYAPALVAFVGGSHFEVALSSGRVGAVGWFPLGPREVYRPAYSVSRTYFTNVNASNTVINNTSITNVYNNRNVTNVTYVNQQVAGAIVAVPTTAFVQSQPVARAALAVPRDAVVRAPVTSVAAIAPMQVSVRGAAAQGAKPPSQVLDRPAIARTAPPVAPVGFAAKERALASSPGKPIDPSALAALKPATPVQARKVEVVAPTRSTQPAAAPPPRSAQTNAGGKDEQRGQPQPRAMAPAPPAVTAPQTPAPTQSTPRAPAQQPGAPVAKAPAAPEGVATPTPPQRTAMPPQGATQPPPAVSRPPQATAPAIVQAPPEQRNKPETRSQPPPQSPVAAPPAITRPPQAGAPAIVQAPPEQRNKPETGAQPAPRPPVSAPPEQRNKPETGAQPAPRPPISAPPVIARPPQVNAPAPAQAPPQPNAEARGRPPVAIVAPPVPKTVEEPPRARPEAPAAAKPMPTAPAAPAPAARPPEPPRAAGAPASVPPPKAEQRGNQPRPAGDKKGDEPAKSDKKGDEPAKGDKN